jgi:hypothetical protein
MDEELAEEILFESLVEGLLDFTTGVPISAVRLLLRAASGFDEKNPKHQSAAKRAIRRYIDYGNLPSGHFDYSNI